MPPSAMPLQAISFVFGRHYHAFVLPVICYLYILYFGLSGSKPNSARYMRVLRVTVRRAGSAPR